MKRIFTLLFIFICLSSRLQAQYFAEEGKVGPDLPNAIQYFGVSIAIDGNYAVIGADGITNVGDRNGIAYVYFYNGTSWELQARLRASDGIGGNDFGTAVAIENNTIVIGAPDAPSPTGSGAAYVFVKPASGWADMKETAKLTASDGTSGSELGEKVAISGGTVFVADRNHHKNGTNAGAVYLFRKPGAGWADVAGTATLVPSDGAEGDLFGSSLGVYGNTLVVGAPGKNSSSGAAYVFSFSPTSTLVPIQKAILKSSDLATGDLFGASVAISGNTVAVAAPGRDEEARYLGFRSNVGAVYVFQQPSTGWKSTVQTAKLTDVYNTADLGRALVIDKDVIIAGERGGNEAFLFKMSDIGWQDMTSTTANITYASASNIGYGFGSDGLAISDRFIMAGVPRIDEISTVYTYDRLTMEGTRPTETDQIREPLSKISLEREKFGGAIDVEGDYAVVGAKYDDSEGADSGIAYILHFDGTSWEKVAILKSSDIISKDYFGNAVAMSGNTVVVSAPGYSTRAGRVFVFEKPASGWTNMTETAILSASGGVVSDRFGATVDIDDHTIVVTSESSDRTPAKVYLFEKPAAASWTSTTETALLSASDAPGNDFRDIIVKLDNETVVVGAKYFLNPDITKGAAYVFEKPVSGWVDATETAKLLPSDGKYGSHFGTDVAISGNTIVVGAPGDIGTSETGALYVFEKPEEGWVNMTESVQLSSSTPSQDIRIGNSLTFYDNTIFSICRSSNVHAIYAFRKMKNGWSYPHEVSRIYSSNSSPSAGLSTTASFSFNGQFLLVGAVFDNTFGKDAGSVYVFRFNNSAPVFIPAEQPIEINEDSEYTIDLSKHFGDPEGDEALLSYSIVSSTHTSLFTASIEGNQMKITPVENATGEASISFMATDVFGGERTGEVVVRVLPVTDGPVVSVPTPLTYGESTKDGLIVEPAPVDSDITNYFYVSAVSGGVLKTKSGLLINEGDFITKSEGVAGFVFTPDRAGENYVSLNAATSKELSSVSIDTTKVYISTKKAPLTIAANAAEKVYGEAVPPLSFSLTGFVAGEDETVLTSQPTINSVAEVTSEVGSYAILVAGGEAENYSFSYENAELTVHPAPLSIQVEDKTKIYGASIPPFSFTVEGFVLGENESVLTTRPAYNTTAMWSSPVGTYAITAEGAVAANYIITYQPGEITVTPKVLSVQVQDASKVYGAPLPELGITITGYVLDEDESSLDQFPSVSTPADATSPVGTYPITANGGAAGNYIFQYSEGSLEVSPAVLVVSAQEIQKKYGEENPPFTYTFDGFVLGESEADIDQLPQVVTSATASSEVGTYDLSISGATDANYTFSYQNALLEVQPAVLTAAAHSSTKIYGAPNPDLSFDITGFVLGEGEEVLVTWPSVDTEATTNSQVGTYAITVRGGAARNYRFAYQQGELEVEPEVLAVRVEDVSKTYGAAVPTLTYTISGFVTGEDESVLSSLPNLHTTAIATSAVGIYPVIAGDAAADNYTFSYAEGTLEVRPKTLTVRASNATKVYGAVLPEVNYSITGFALNEDESFLDQLPTISTTATDASPVGTYPVTLAHAADANYSFTYSAGVLEVTQAPLIVTVQNAEREYGEENPTFSLAYQGFVLGEQEEVLNQLPTVSTSANISSAVGAYSIVASGAVSDNYQVSYETGVLNIKKAPLSVSVQEVSRNEGEANPTFELIYVGFKLEETEEVLDVLPTANTSATAESPAGIYSINVSGGEDNNYAFTYSSGSLIVQQLTGVRDELAGELKIYPTPASSYLMVELSKRMNGNIQLLDLNGRKLFDTAVDGQLTRLDVNKLPAGVYLLKVATSQGTSIRKVIKQ